MNEYEAIYAAVKRIPRGRVCTYGGVAALAGLPGRARMVGYALFALPEGTRVPWHRVFNAQGKLSLERVVPGGGLQQRFRLEREGVEFDAGGRVSLARYGWKSTEY
jgi:methylated-DNA-protein-cysteine methyltransferase-like protein